MKTVHQTQLLFRSLVRRSSEEVTCRLDPTSGLHAIIAIHDRSFGGPWSMALARASDLRRDRRPERVGPHFTHANLPARLPVHLVAGENATSQPFALILQAAFLSDCFFDRFDALVDLRLFALPNPMDFASAARWAAYCGATIG